MRCEGETASRGATRTAVEIEAAGPCGPLKGTLIGTLRAGGLVVLLVPGSGPTDRDGNSPFGVRASPYRLLAEGLAERGIASVRIDKRGLFGSAAAWPDPDAVTLGDYVEDVAAWLAAIRRRSPAGRIWLAGHSEGGLVALAAAARGMPGLCGLVLLSCPGRPPGALWKEQLRLDPATAPFHEAATRAIEAMAAGRAVEDGDLPAPLLPLLRPATRRFLASLFALDPLGLARKVSVPVLVVQGTRDLQVGVRDAQKLAKAAPAASLALLPDVNHVMKTVRTDDRGENLAAYADPDLPLAPGVADAVADFLLASDPRSSRAP